jgi:hypothetical protein
MDFERDEFQEVEIGDGEMETRGRQEGAETRKSEGNVTRSPPLEEARTA